MGEPLAMAGRLAGRVAIVTGSARGIGASIAARLAAEGAAVVINDVDAEACAATAHALSEAGARTLSVPGDVTDPEATEAAIATVREEFGALDILVNNAGVVRDAPIHRMSDEDWQLVQNVALRGAFYMCRSAAGLLRGPREATPAHHRKVVNISSAVGIYGAPGTVNYSAAKAGLIGLTKALSREWARHHVNVNAVAPGFVTGTQMSAAKPAELLARLAGEIPIGRAGTPEDVAAAVAFLASPDSDFMTGQVLELHGGMEVMG